MKRTLLATLAAVSISLALPASAAEKPIWEQFPNDYKATTLLIVKSTTDYSEALRFAKEASQKLDMKLDLRDLSPVPGEIDVSLPKEKCKEYEWDYPCYNPRGGSVDATYLSIETSSGYPGLAEGYFIVVAADGGEAVKKALPAVKKHYADAYPRKTKIFIGCTH